MFRQALVGGIYLTWIKDMSYDEVDRLPGVVPSDRSLTKGEGGGKGGEASWSGEN